MPQHRPISDSPEPRSAESAETEQRAPADAGAAMEAAPVIRYRMMGVTSGWMEPSENGEYVSAHDYEALLRERDELKQRLESVIAECPKGWLP